MRVVPVPLPADSRPEAPCRPFGIASLDAALGGGLRLGRVHEVYAAEPGDGAAACGFALMTATAAAAETGAGLPAGERPMLWLRTRRAARLGGVIQANGWAELAGGPDRVLFGLVPDAMTLLRAAVDALRCNALGAVVVEEWGTMRELDLTASRRLALSAEKSGVPLLLVRADATPLPSAAQTRWQVAAGPSLALPGNAPGRPTFDVTLLRQRSGPSGLDWRLEWDRDQRMFREAPPLSGAVVSVPAGRPAAAGGTTGTALPGRHAA